MKRKTRTEPPVNDIQLFHLYPNGFGLSFAKWMNYHDIMHGLHPLGCRRFGENGCSDGMLLVGCWYVQRAVREAAINVVCD